MKNRLDLVKLVIGIRERIIILLLVLLVILGFIIFNFVQSSKSVIHQGRKLNFIQNSESFVYQVRKLHKKYQKTVIIDKNDIKFLLQALNSDLTYNKSFHDCSPNWKFVKKEIDNSNDSCILTFECLTCPKETNTLFLTFGIKMKNG